MSNVYIKKRMGPSTDPCGIPLVNVDHLERVSCNFTLCFLFIRKHSSQLKSLPLMPQHLVYPREYYAVPCRRPFRSQYRQYLHLTCYPGIMSNFPGLLVG